MGSRSSPTVINHSQRNDDETNPISETLAGGRRGLETEADIDRKAVPKLYPTCARLAARDGILLGGKLIREGKTKQGGGMAVQVRMERKPFSG